MPDGASRWGTVNMRVRLFTRGGSQFVVDQVIPSFNEPPGVLIWGERYFVYDPSTAADDLGALTYREAFAYAASPYQSVH